jgi:hypothetical protein
MAVMIPDLSEEQILAEHDSPAEARVYGALRDQLSSDVTVLYSVPWIAPGRRGEVRDGEADFVVIDPSHGILILEVKGGTVEVASGGRWSTRGPAGEIIPITNPFTQGVTSKNVLKNQIDAIPGVDISGVTFGHGVILPDALGSPGNLGLDAPSEVLITGDNLDSMQIKIDQIFSFWGRSADEPLQQDVVRLITDRIFPRQVITPPLGVAVRSAEERIVSLTDQQIRYIGFLRDQRRVCIEGPAGTGKTVLAVEKAKQLASEGVQTLLTCFNNRLAARLQDHLSDLPNLSIWTFHDTCKRLAEEAGFEMPSSAEGFDSKFFDETLPDMLIRALDVLPERRFGAVIVDEAQDLEPEWWELLELLLDDSDDTWLWTFRDSGQNLYGREQVLPEGFQVFRLSENIRNSVKIHEAATPFAPGDSGTCLGPGGGEVRYELATNPRATRSVVGRVLHQLINEGGLKREDVIVLTATSVGRSSLANVEKVGAFNLELPDAELGGGVEMDSVWRFKGLEKPAVIVTDLSNETDDALRYVAMTRARGVLVLVGTEDGLKRA